MKFETKVLMYCLMYFYSIFAKTFIKIDPVENTSGVWTTNQVSNFKT